MKECKNERQDVHQGASPGHLLVILLDLVFEHHVIDAFGNHLTLNIIFLDTLRIHGCQICGGANDAPNVCNLHTKCIIDAF